jgi:hypothetical protein
MEPPTCAQILSHILGAAFTVETAQRNTSARQETAGLNGQNLEMPTVTLYLRAWQYSNPKEDAEK